jgi:signal transduction histidine kinase
MMQERPTPSDVRPDERSSALAHRCDRLEQELGQARQQLGVARRLLLDQARLVSVGQLVAGIAHELKNPANFVYGGAVALVEQLERNDSESREKLLKLARIVQTGAERIRDMTNSLNAFCGKSPRDQGQLDVGDAVRSTVALLEPQARQRGVTIDIELQGKVLSQGDKGELCQVISNVLLNAIQASRQGGRVEVGATADRGQVVLSVRDHGTGMSPDVAARIFEPFFTTKEETEGTGLGLTISQSILERQGGRLEVESSPGVGSVFSIILPAGAKQEATHG